LTKEIVGEALVQGGQNCLVIFPASELLRCQCSTQLGEWHHIPAQFLVIHVEFGMHKLDGPH
jgi:hypothetical protein